MENYAIFVLHVSTVYDLNREDYIDFSMKSFETLEEAKISLIKEVYRALLVSYL